MNDDTHLPAPSPATGLGEQLMRLISDPNIGADKMQVLLQMQREIITERRRESFQRAFALLAARMPQVTKDGVVELTNKDGKRLGRYKFAKWEDMDTVIRPLLSEYGFALTFYSRVGDGGRTIFGGRLLHIDGHSETAERYLKPDPGPGRNDLQAEGSGQSYAKRYTAEALLNIVRKGEDDDGVSAMAVKLTDKQADELGNLLVATKTSPEKFLTMFVTGCDSVADIPARDFARLKNALEEKKAALLKKGKQDAKTER